MGNLDGICDKWESISSCPLDCHCGNNICDKELGENADNCPSDCTKGCEEMEDKYDGDGISSSMDTMHHECDMANMHMHHKSDMDMNMHHKSNVNVNIHEDGMHYSSSSDSEDMEGDSCKENGNHVLIIRIAAALHVNRFVLAAKYFSDMNGR